jgi:hypothetical protein
VVVGVGLREGQVFRVEDKLSAVKHDLEANLLHDDVRGVHNAVCHRPPLETLRNRGARISEVLFPALRFFRTACSRVGGKIPNVANGCHHPSFDDAKDFGRKIRRNSSTAMYSKRVSNTYTPPLA